MNGMEKIPVGNFGDLVQVLGANNRNVYAELDKMAKELAKVSKQNKYLALTCAGLTLGLYLSNKRIGHLELKVNSLEKVNNFMRNDEDDSK